LELAKTIVKNMTGEFNIGEYKDEYREKLLQAIELKISGQNIVVPQDNEVRTNVLSLMDALQQSLKFPKKRIK
jgi:DNA end-binding protein Ku